LLTDDKDTLWDGNRAQVTATRESIGGEKLQTRVRIENNYLKFIAFRKTVIGDN
jgi:hypothetical protein